MPTQETIQLSDVLVKERGMIELRCVGRGAITLEPGTLLPADKVVLLAYRNAYPFLLTRDDAGKFISIETVESDSATGEPVTKPTLSIRNRKSNN